MNDARWYLLVSSVITLGYAAICLVQGDLKTGVILFGVSTISYAGGLVIHEHLGR